MDTQLDSNLRILYWFLLMWLKIVSFLSGCAWLILPDLYLPSLFLSSIHCFTWIFVCLLRVELFVVCCKCGSTLSFDELQNLIYFFGTVLLVLVTFWFWLFMCFLFFLLVFFQLKIMLNNLSFFSHSGVLP